MVQRLVILALLCTACGGTVMTRGDYDSVQHGEPQQNFTEQYGSPYEVNSLPDGTQEYHYIERIPIRRDRVDENHYFIIIKDGKVISKRTTNTSCTVDLNFNG